MNRNKYVLILAAMLMALPLLVSSCGDGYEDPFESDDDGHGNTTNNNSNNNTNNSNNTDNNQSAKKSEYTIIYYGHGGGDLDFSILDNIDDLFLADKSSYDKVQAAVQYKISSETAIKEALLDGESEGLGIDPEKYGHRTLRFVVNPKKNFLNLLLNKLDDIALPDEDIDIAATETLADFIKWAKEKCPADNYILVISDHGGGYSPEDELPTGSLSKGLVYDDGANYDHLTAQKIVDAVTLAGIRPKVIYLDACLMNTVEYQYELKDIADYLVLSSFSVPGPGGNYVSLVNELAKNADIESALTKFCASTVKRWDEEYDEETESKIYPYSDISVIRTSGLDALAAEWKEFTTRLISAYQSNAKTKAAIDNVTANMYAMECDYPLYDMVYFAKAVVKSVPGYYDAQFAKGLLDAYNGTVVCSRASADLEKYGYKIGCSILFGCKGHYTSFSWMEDEETGEQYLDGYVTYGFDGTMRFYDQDGKQYDSDNWGGTIGETYKQLKFDQLTGWSTWMEINEQEASAYSPASLFYEITADGFEEVEYEDDLPIAAKK